MTFSPILENVEALLARTQSEDESGTNDVSEQQRILEEENIEADESQSSAGTLTLDRGDKIMVDGSGSTIKPDSNKPDSNEPGTSAGCSQLRGQSTLAASAVAQTPVDDGNQCG